MIETTLAHVAEATGGVLRGDGAPVVTGVTCDSRAVRRGDLFVAVRGEHHDGHDHVAEARSAGAVAALVERAVDDGPDVVVASTVHGLGRLAADVLARLRDEVPLEVVGITGSVGKTSTKDLLAQVLSPLGPVVAPAGNQNNELGLPSTVLRCDRDTRALVLEIGARARGDVRYLAGLTRPRVGVVLAVGSAHVGEFGSVQAIMEAKSELVQDLPAAADGGVAVLNVDDPRVAAMAGLTAARVVTFGTSVGADVRAADVQLAGEARPTFLLRTPAGDRPVRLRLTGRPAVTHALAATAVAHALGLGLDTIVAGLESARPRSVGRARVRQGLRGTTILDDSYNASPESLAAALQTLVDLAAGEGRTWAVLGEMRELGEGSAAAHAAAGRLAADLGVDRVVGVGDGARGIVAAAGPGAALVPDVDAAVALLEDGLSPGDVVLVKASRAVGLDRVADRLDLGEAGP